MRRRTGSANIEFREADVFDFLASEAHGRGSYSTIVLDPPAFAKSRSARGRRGSRIQGDQPARAAIADAWRRVGDVFLFASHE